MPIRDLKDAELSARLHANNAVEEPVRQVNRQGDEKRGSSDTRLEKFAAKVRPEPKKPVVDRRRKRKSTADIKVPSRQFNMSALRFGLRGLDIVLVCAIIALGIWNGYSGVNGRGVIAPIAASILGSCLLYTSPSPRDATLSRMPSSA